MTGHTGFDRMIKENKLTVGLTMPIENHGHCVPTLERQAERAQLAEELGFTSIWFQDVLLEDPTFEDPATGQVYDSFIYLTYIGSHTTKINLGTAASVLSLRHPLRLAKEVSSIERLFPERLMLGLSSGDRRKDFEGLGVDIMRRGELFRESYEYFNRVIQEEFPSIQSPLGQLDQSNLVPKPTKRIPIFLTGYAQQTLDWVSSHGDGWMFYPQRAEKQQALIQEYREKSETNNPGFYKAFIQPLSLDLSNDQEQAAKQVKLKLTTGVKGLLNHLQELESIGVNHVMISLSGSTRPVEEVMKEMGEYILPHFPPHEE
ncbi:coenzyme F420-dependent N5,N10-methylene tetrahydromethanopterin reductase [Pontibacillus halophilus JSM 076056 = DSM 19796]|uniref:Coenzyme F420-dependent N5,N10-methylene tetrahydromethanopterin reductase n=1 Tax=Pontibacillus halophilus JSM 076056 = DSM 19796 TaxID=1385510 RepID=A0A0A5GLD6_9BACI|nr:TIGR03571 family LLM class oxidoreductase [Pontibacillus halophilus]KGX91970.1 coenzyme F420-dependent N5,N10-methylene tetrahydromethanopterin reductase [Pontibacillus halophilus JSM 076056 = DSM 19796]